MTDDDKKNDGVEKQRYAGDVAACVNFVLLILLATQSIYYSRS